MKNTHYTLGLMAVALLALSGCSRSIDAAHGDAPNLRSWTQEVELRDPVAPDPLPVLTKFEPLPYSTANERDPFNPKTAADDEPSPLRPDVNRRKQPLEAFALDSLKMVGTMGGGDSLSALVLAPDGITYRVRAGDYLGQSDGRVVAVLADRVKIVEVAVDNTGTWAERDAGLVIPGAE